MLRREQIWSPNYSSRGGARVTTIVLHTAEGATTYQDLGAWFANPASQVSSHVGVDDQPGVVGEYVDRDWKAWTASNANPWSVQAELCAFAAWDAQEWDRHPAMLENCAAWVAEEADWFDIPLIALTPAGAQDPNVKGVCQHNDLGSMGGGHWDCGPDFPLDRVLAMAAGGAPEPEPPPLPEGTPEMTFLLVAGGAQYLVDTTSGFFAPNSPNMDPNVPVMQGDRGLVTAIEAACASVRSRTA